MKGIIRKIEYEGDFPTFYKIAREAIKTGGGLVYNVDEKRGVIIEPDCTVGLGVRLSDLEVITRN